MARLSRIVLLLACMAGGLLAAPVAAQAVPAVTLGPITPSPSKDRTPSFHGTASTDAADAQTVTVRVFNGPALVATVTAPVGALGAYQVNSTQLPADGNFTAVAEQQSAAADATATSGGQTFTIDNTGPTASITGGPSGTVNSGSANFTFKASETSTFECKMDNGSGANNFSACSSPKGYTVGQGSHTFRLRATDGLGNLGPTVARTFTVDSGAPAVTLTSPAADSATNDTTPTFSGKAGTASGDLPAITVTIYDGDDTSGGVVRTLTTNASGGSWSVTPGSGLDEGTYTVRAQQSDTALNTGASNANTFTIDTTPPDTTITGGPGGVTESAIATYSFVSSKPGSTFQCRVDSSPYTTCASPYTFTGLGEGAHTALIRAVDAAGNVDASPATRSWTILNLHPPIASFTVSPAAPLTGQTVTFTSTSTDPDNALASQAWDLDNDGRFNDGTAKVVGCSWPRAGSYKVRLLVVDSQGISVVEEKTITVANRPPTVTIAATPGQLRVGKKVTFKAAAADADGTVAKLAWDLDGDGKYDDASGPTAVHTFKKAGRAKVSLRVTDDLGATTTSTDSLKIAEQALLNPFPIVRISGRFTSKGVSLSRLLVEAPKGAHVSIRCRGKGCPRKKISRAVATRGSAAKSLRFATFERFLPTGTVLDVRVTKSGQIGKFTRIRVHSGRAPSRTDRCLARGKSVRCPK